MEIILWTWLTTVILVAGFEHLVDWLFGKDSCALFCNTFVSEHSYIVGEMTNWSSESTLWPKYHSIGSNNISSKISNRYLTSRVVINLWYPFAIAASITYSKIIRVGNSGDIECGDLWQTNTDMFCYSFANEEVESYAGDFLDYCTCEAEV